MPEVQSQQPQPPQPPQPPRPPQPPQPPTTPKTPTTAFVLSLIAGVWMLSMGVVMSDFGMMRGYGMSGGPAVGRFGRDGGYGMHAFGGMHGWLWGSGMYGVGASRMWLGVAAGLLVIISAFAMYVKPVTRQGFGLLILVVSVIDFVLGMGGLLAGVLGIVGGALALAA